MRMNILAAVVAVAFSGTALAVELYKTDDTSISLGGHVSVNLSDSELGHFGIGTNSPRLNIVASHDIGNGFTVGATSEWAVNLLENSENSFTTRLGNIGVAHNELGIAVVGTQWSPYYDVMGATDKPIAFANDFLYDAATEIGTGRADKMASYRNGVELLGGELSAGVGYQSSQTQATAFYDDRFQLGLAYKIGKVQFGYAMTTGDVKLATESKTEPTTSNGVAAAYGSYGDGLYVAVAYAMNENINVDDKKARLDESTSYELLGSYTLPNGLNVAMNYENVTGENKGEKSQDIRSELGLVAEYGITSNFVTYGGYQFDLSDAKETDNKWALGIRYYL
ncbi:porin [Vibrio campbellii]|uniref:porin n=1 Tax=Vibrio campbellii TaxID=680 RepID=UPI000CD366E8|nr:porin [Vibrio campbellii]AUW07408.1 porin [Vibrio campbellii]